MSLNQFSLADVCSIKHGYAFKGEYFSDSITKNILLTPGNFNIGGGFKKDKLKYYDGPIDKNYILKPYDLIVTMTDLSKDGDTLGYSALVPKDDNVYLHNQRIGLIENINEEVIDKNYLYWLLRDPRYHHYVVSSSTGTTVKHTSPKTILKYEFELPSIKKQNFIGQVLTKIELKIDLNKEINKNLDGILDLLFKENFIDKFDNDASDWKIKKVGELPLIITDYVANGSFASLKENVSILDYEDYAYFIRNTDLKAKCFEKFVNKHSYDFLKKSSLFGNEVIISNVGDVGSVFLCPFLDKPMTLGNNMILVKSNNNDIYLNFYLFLLFRSNYGQYLISTITAGSVQSKFNKTEFKSLELTMPDDELIIKFNELVSPIFEYKNKVSDEITNLTKLRDTLLPKLMSGEIDVSKINCDK